MKSKNLCNFCNYQLRQEVINIGKTPLANSYTNHPLKLTKHVLHVFFCTNCYLVQHSTNLKGENIFSQYQYFSSYSKNFVSLAKENIDKLIKTYKINDKSTIVEIASNDGYLLQHIKNKKINYYGIEPAKNIAKIANKKGIKTINSYLNIKSSKEILKKNNKADLIIANNVFAHVPKIHNFIKSMINLMTNNCIICIEVPHLKNLIKYNQFDTIYHEHFYYFSLSSLKKIFKEYNLKIIDVDKINTHGGSLRVHITKDKNKVKIRKKVSNLIKEEIESKLTKKNTYKIFNKRVNKLKKEILKFHKENQNKIIYGFGAAAKACTLINYCELNFNSIRYIYDETAAKIGKYIPGTDIKIIKFGRNINKNIDIIIIFPWNHYSEIKKKIQSITKKRIQLVRFIPNIKSEFIN